MNKATAKALIVRTAKAHGVKDATSVVRTSAEAFNRLLESYIEKGRGADGLANTVYSAADMSKIQMRAQQLQRVVQSLPADSRQARDAKTAAGEIIHYVGDFPQMINRNEAWRMSGFISNITPKISTILRSLGSGR